MRLLLLDVHHLEWWLRPFLFLALGFTGFAGIAFDRGRPAGLGEHLLDRLLDCACIPEGLALFRSLCRYYYYLNPAATADYIGAYREMWDNDDTEEANA